MLSGNHQLRRKLTDGGAMADTHVNRANRRDRVAHAFELALAELPTLAQQDLTEMARAATRVTSLGTPSPLRQLTPRRLALGIAAALALALATPLLAGINPLDEIAQLTGIREEPPPAPSAGYQPADVPYVSVQPLMRYIGSDKPVIPSTALVTRNGRRIVFVVSRPDYTSRYTQLSVHARPVTIGAQIGNAVAITAGLTPCDRVVISPPQTLGDGDRIRSYAEDVADNGPSIDYSVLFAGRPQAPASPIEGGIAAQDGNQVVIGITYSGTTPPPGAHYVFHAPNGAVQDIPYKLNANARVPEDVLKQGEPVGSVELEDATGKPLARATLDWYCTS